ncbi:hypothetical protein ACLOJK_023516 [Asimina triloba]
MKNTKTTTSSNGLQMLHENQKMKVATCMTSMNTISGELETQAPPTRMSPMTLVLPMEILTALNPPPPSTTPQHLPISQTIQLFITSSTFSQEPMGAPKISRAQMKEFLDECLQRQGISVSMLEPFIEHRPYPMEIEMNHSL